MKDDENKNIVLLGASFDTGNLGISALAWSSISLVLRKWPQANIEIVGTVRNSGCDVVNINGIERTIETKTIRFCRNIFASNHIFALMFWGLFFKIPLPWFLKGYASYRHPALKTLLQSDYTMDITGGDSFTDIYGGIRFWYGTLPKLAAIWLSKSFILLPQTYGPFISKMSLFFLKYIAKKSRFIYSRDIEGKDIISKILGSDDKVLCVPDVAFVLEPVKPSHPITEIIEKENDKGVVCVNISGLLYNGGYGRKTEDLSLKCGYVLLLKNLVEYFVQQGNRVFLVPHVIPGDSHLIENDFVACRVLYDSLADEIKSNVIVVSDDFDQCQIKYIIGRSDFFIGSRMHSCIAAISQKIPTIGLAYSRKFKGVFEEVGLGDWAIDLKKEGDEEVMSKVKEKYKCRDKAELILKESVSEAKSKLYSLFDVLEVKG